MPRANRYFLAGCLYHLTHRCHDRKFGFRFGVVRTEYCRRLRQALKLYGVSLLAYCITSNHPHLLAQTPHERAVNRMMQKLEGDFPDGITCASGIVELPGRTATTAPRLRMAPMPGTA